jgi:hypothetical protein
VKWLATLGLLLIGGCGSGSIALPLQTTPSPKAHLPDGRPAHVAVLVMENEEYGDVISSQQTPYITGLARTYGLATRSYAITHPSLPNYLALSGGSTFGVDSDCTDCSVPGAGLVGQLQAHHLTWKAYMEDLPHACFNGVSADGYAKKHNPFVYYRALPSCRNIVPLTQLYADERSRKLPAFAWITPNLCHDMHDCSPRTGDRFLSGLVPSLLRALGKRGVLFLTWDEGTSDDGCCRLASGGHVATIVAGPGARRDAQLRMPTDHYSVVQTIEDLLGLRRLGGARCACTPSLQPLLAGR